MKSSSKKSQTSEKKQAKAQEYEYTDSEGDDDENAPNKEGGDQVAFVSAFNSLQTQLLITKRLHARIRLIKARYQKQVLIMNAGISGIEGTMLSSPKIRLTGRSTQNRAKASVSKKVVDYG